jgi:uncharacterized membrane protein
MQKEKTTPASAGTETTSPMQTHPQRHGRVLFRHEPHQHQPRNVNQLHAAEQAGQGFNTRLAVALTKYTGTMWTAYLFAGIGIGSLVGVFTNNAFLALFFGSISSYFLQLVLLPVIMTGQNVLGRKAELQADEAFNTTMSTYHDIEQIMQHLLAQDAELLHHTKMLIHLLEKNGISLQQLETEGASTSVLDSYVQPQPAGGAAAAPAPTAGEKPNA